MQRLSVLITAAALLAGAAASSFAAAGQALDDTQHAAPGASRMSSGEVVKVDRDAAKITIKHGPLANLNMPGMTMVFKAKDPALLARVKAGDKINFVAEQVNGALIVTKIEAV